MSSPDLPSEHWRQLLVVQWLGFSTFTTKGLGSIPGQGTNIPHATCYGQKKKSLKWALELCLSQDIVTYLLLPHAFLSCIHELSQGTPIMFLHPQLRLPKKTQTPLGVVCCVCDLRSLDWNRKLEHLTVTHSLSRLLGAQPELTDFLFSLTFF